MRAFYSLMLAIPLAVGCGDDDGENKTTTGLDCGEGTHEEDGSCVPDEEPLTDADGGDDDGGSDDGGSDDTGTGEDSGTTDTGTTDTGTTDADGGPVGTDEDGDGITLEDGDCNDSDATIYPFAGDTYGDGTDSDCDGMDCEAAYVGAVYYAVCRESADGADLKTSWSDANVTCTAHGYESLAKVDSVTERDALRGLVLTAGEWPDTWIGLSDPEDDGTWHWMDGSELTVDGWGPGEPTTPGEDNCVEIYSVNDWTWNDRTCTENFPFACELRP